MPYKNVALNTESAYFDAGVENIKRLKLVMVHPNSKKGWHDQKDKDFFRVVNQKEIMNAKNSDTLFNKYAEQDPKLFDYVESFVSEYNTYHIFDRKYTGKVLNQMVLKATDLLVQCYALLKEEEIDLVITHDSPHSLVDFTFCRCAEYMGIRVLNIRKSIYPWRVKVFDGLGVKSSHLQFDFDNANEHLQQLAKDYEKTLRASDYMDMMPSGDKKMYSAAKGKLFHWPNEIREVIAERHKKNMLQNFRSRFYKVKALKSMQRIWKRPEKGEKYVSFFLHRQPERSTCPEGGIFNTQIMVAKYLRAMLPDDVAIYVKEHPATFRRKINHRYRYMDFYNDVMSIPNAYMADMTAPETEFIDNSLFCSTITGTIGFEAVARGKNLLYFGDSSYKGCPNTYFVEDVIANPELKEKLLRSNPDERESYREFMDFELKNSHGNLNEGEGFADKEVYQRSWTEAFIKFLDKWELAETEA